MPKNVDVVLNDLNGKPIPEDAGVDSKPATIRFVAVNALLAEVPNEYPSGDEKAKRYTLAINLHPGGEHEFTPEEFALVKRLVGQVYGPLIVGQVYEWANVRSRSPSKRRCRGMKLPGTPCHATTRRRPHACA